MTKTLRDYVQFDMVPLTYDTLRKERKLIAGIKAECEIEADEEDMLVNFASLFTCTQGVKFHFDGTERAPLIAFKQRWEGLGKKPSFKQIWELRITLPSALLTAWQEEFIEGQELFEVPVEQRPLRALTLEQQEEAKQNDSPLPERIAAGKSV